MEPKATIAIEAASLGDLNQALDEVAEAMQSVLTIDTKIKASIAIECELMDHLRDALRKIGYAFEYTDAHVTAKVSSAPIAVYFGLQLTPTPMERAIRDAQK